MEGPRLGRGQAQPPGGQDRGLVDQVRQVSARETRRLLGQRVHGDLGRHLRNNDREARDAFAEHGAHALQLANDMVDFVHRRAGDAPDQRIQVIMECTEHKNSGMPGTSRYVTVKNKKNTPERNRVRHIEIPVIDRE